jgi:hypothetical protein
MGLEMQVLNNEGHADGKIKTPTGDLWFDKKSTSERKTGWRMEYSRNSV